MLPFDEALQPLRRLRQRAENILGEIERDRFRLHIYRRVRRGWGPSVVIFGHVEQHRQDSVIRVFVVPHWTGVFWLACWIGLSTRWASGISWLWVIGLLIQLCAYAWEVFDAHRLFLQTYSSNHSLEPTAGGRDAHT